MERGRLAITVARRAPEEKSLLKGIQGLLRFAQVGIYVADIVKTKGFVKRVVGFPPKCRGLLI